METVLDFELTEQQTTGEYPPLDETFSQGLFYGYHVKNKYDEERLLIQNIPGVAKFTFSTNNGPFKLYGLLNKNTSSTLLTKLTNTPPGNIGEYNSFLTLNGLSCLTCFLYFSPGLYPIDTHYSKRFFPDIENSIFSCNKKVAKFQRMAHTYLFALINLNKKI